MAKGKASPGKNSKALWVVAAVAVIAVAALIGINWMQNRQTAAPPEAGTSTAGVPLDRTTRGPANAKVVLVEYGDYG